METISLDLRRRIVAAYDRGEGTREDVAKRYNVSLGFVAKLLHQRRQTKDIAPRHKYSGRKPKLLAEHRRQLRAWLSQKPDLTLRELHEMLGLNCTLPAIHYVLVDLGLTYKKRRCGPASRTGRTSAKRAGRGGGGRAASTRPSSSSSMNRVQKPT